MAGSGKALDRTLIRRMYRYVVPYRHAFFISILLTLALAVVAPVRPYLIQYTVDHHILYGDGKGLLMMILVMTGLLIFQSIIQYYHTFLTNSLGQSAIRDLRKHLYNHIVSLRLRFFDRTPIGTLVTRTVSDLETIADVFSEGLIVIIGDLLQLSFIVAWMFYIDWKLTLISLSTLPFLLLATYVFKEKIKSAFNDVRNEVAKLNAFLQEHITGMSVVQVFAREKAEMEKFKEINARHRDANIRSVLYYSVFFPVVEIISAASIGLLVWYGSKSVIEHSTNPGVLISFIIYINMLFRPIRELADKFNTLQLGMVSADRIFKVLDTQEQTENKGTYQPEKIRGQIEFGQVWFAYQEEDWVLKDISFRVNEGQTLALVGATGAGKSSIINLLNRFYEINTGSVRIDGTDIREYELGYLRSNIATVLQDVFLFSDTISNNISLKNSMITREQIMDAAREVGAEEFIRKLPGNYDYNVMERGATLSSGQAQLLSFIRALVYNPKILVLDEATSSIDTETELLIQRAIEKLMQGRTSIVIAHRLSTIQHADQILVLDKGEIREAGTHQQLLKQNGLYKRLYDLQFSSSGIRV